MAAAVAGNVMRRGPGECPPALVRASHRCEAEIAAAIGGESLSGSGSDPEVPGATSAGNVRWFRIRVIRPH